MRWHIISHNVAADQMHSDQAVGQYDTLIAAMITTLIRIKRAEARGEPWCYYLVDVGTETEAGTMVPVAYADGTLLVVHNQRETQVRIDDGLPQVKSCPI